MPHRQTINFKQLRCFHAVALEGGFTAAARTLGVGQPSVTTHIKALETSYGVELFARHGHSVELTDIGRSLFAITQRIFAQEGEATELLRAASGLRVGHLKVGAIGPFQVTGMLLAFGQAYPDVKLSVSLGNSQEVLDGLLDFNEDVAVLVQVEDDPRLFSMPYSRNQVIIFVSRSHPWAGRKAVKIGALEGQRMVLREVGSATRRAFENAIADANVRINTVLEIASREAVREAVASGIGIGIAMAEEFLPDERLRPIHVSDAEIYVQPHVACLRERRDAPLIKAFLDVVRGLATDGQAFHG